MEASPLHLLAFVAIVIFSVVATIMGVRLLLLWRRTRQVPELALGIALMMIATFGYPLSMLAAMVVGEGLWVRVPVYLACAGSVDLGLIATGVFTWRVFRPTSKIALGAVIAGSLALFTLLATNAIRMVDLDLSVGYGPGTRVPTTLLFVVSTAFFGWACAESARWWRLLRRRVALGLADPVTTNRFLLWSLWGLGTACGAVVNGICTWLGATIHHPVPLLATSAIGLTNAVVLFLAFFAPRSYHDWLIRRAG